MICYVICSGPLGCLSWLYDPEQVQRQIGSGSTPVVLKSKLTQPYQFLCLSSSSVPRALQGSSKYAFYCLLKGRAGSFFKAAALSCVSLMCRRDVAWEHFLWCFPPTCSWGTAVNGMCGVHTLVLIRVECLLTAPGTYSRSWWDPVSKLLHLTLLAQE